ncbi:hypothetical protein F7734_25760 [Scytonema sp. UIC 10036]|uniref:hypothetical protein n=1 Tax=Scytonema sp. UIC 10036 TaxID=2304196 RepID=UPI0012DACD84|nr:hypothetical protein [Scytonema sp. UIC 10036]MUG95581.1 hypothetical protein [Scytonema sp. UIC 10036]
MKYTKPQRHTPQNPERFVFDRLAADNEHSINPASHRATNLLSHRPILPVLFAIALRRTTSIP